jgi:hyperosmotically inducible protein
MKKNPIVFSLILLFAFFQFAACGGKNNDAAIQNKISSVTQTTPELQNVSASVYKGVVTLVGQCKSEKDRSRAEKAVERIDDVKNVINNITVTDNLLVTPDNELKEQVAKVVKKYKRVQANVNDGVVTVRGSIDEDDIQQLMMDLNGLRPRRIENQLAVE